MSKKYNIIYADPPWRYRAWSKKGQGRSAERHYPTMNIRDIKALPVSELAAERSRNMKFITTAYMPYQFAILPAIGIIRKQSEYRLSLIWGFWGISFGLSRKETDNG